MLWFWFFQLDFMESEQNATFIHSFFITYLLMLATRFFINLSRSWFLMSCSWVTLLISFIQRLPLVVAARCSARAADTCCSVQAKVLRCLTSSRFPTYHGSVLWIMSSTRLPSTPHIARCLPPSPLQSPLINSFHVVNHLCQLLVIIDNSSCVIHCLSLSNSIVLYAVWARTTEVKLPLLSKQQQGVNSPMISCMLQCFGLHFLEASDKGQVEIKLH